MNYVHMTADSNMTEKIHKGMHRSSAKGLAKSVKDNTIHMTETMFCSYRKSHKENVRMEMRMLMLRMTIGKMMK